MDTTIEFLVKLYPIFKECAHSIRGISCPSGWLPGCLVKLAKILSQNLLTVTGWLVWPQMAYSTCVQSHAILESYSQSAYGQALSVFGTAHYQPPPFAAILHKRVQY